jgi:hypothetical protein
MVAFADCVGKLLMICNGVFKHQKPLNAGSRSINREPVKAVTKDAKR